MGRRSIGGLATPSASHVASDGGRGAALSIRLSAAIVTATVDEPRVLIVRIGREPVEALPSGPLEVKHRTLEVGLRAWVERQTSQRLGYVEQLYTFGDRDRTETGETRPGRALTVAYLALVRDARPSGAAEALWQNWYSFFPWEDWRSGRPAALVPVEKRLRLWVRMPDCFVANPTHQQRKQTYDVRRKPGSLRNSGRRHRTAAGTQPQTGRRALEQYLAAKTH